MATDATLDPAAVARLRDLGGDALLTQLIDLFLQNTPKRIQAALEGEQSGNWHEVERAAHSIKSSAANLGFGGLQALAFQIEQLAERARAEAISPLLQELADVYPAIKNRLEELKKSGNA